jgi:hypothetical protein
MTFGYWFWIGVLGIAGALLLLFLTRKGQRKTRTVHAVALFALLAFSGFRCARDEHVRSALLDTDTPVYTIAVTRDDGSGLKHHEDKRRVEAVAMHYRLAGREYVGLGELGGAYTVERDFLPENFKNRCLLIRVPASRPDLSRLVAVLNACPKAPENGWSRIPDNVLGMVDTLWWRETIAR